VTLQSLILRVGCRESVLLARWIRYGRVRVVSAVSDSQVIGVFHRLL
jgi:hypothetical protein